LKANDGATPKNRKQVGKTMTPFDTTQLVPDIRSIYGAKNSIGCVPPSSVGRMRKLPLNGGEPLVCKNVLWPSRRLGRFLESGALDEPTLLPTARNLHATPTIFAPLASACEPITRKPKGHDFVIDRHTKTPAISRHMSVTGGLLHGHPAIPPFTA